MQFPIIVGLHRSRFLERLLLASAGLASLLVIAWPRSTLIQASILAGVWGVAAIAWWRLRQNPCRLRLERDGGLALAPAGEGSDFGVVRLLPGATVHPWLTVFRVELTDRRRRAVLATVDNLPAADFRRLRVFLRWRAGFSAPDGAA